VGKRVRRSRAKPLPRALAALLAASLAAAAAAIEMRVPTPITTPSALSAGIADDIANACAPAPCAGLSQVVDVRPVSARTVRDAVGRITAAWNTADLERHLGAGFFNRARLSDTLREVVPRDARLRVLSVRNVQTLAQYVESGRDADAATRVSTVRATVVTQLEFNDPREGFVRSRRSAQEVLLVIAEQGAR